MAGPFRCRRFGNKVRAMNEEMNIPRSVGRQTEADVSRMHVKLPQCYTMLPFVCGCIFPGSAGADVTPTSGRRCGNTCIEGGARGRKNIQLVRFRLPVCLFQLFSTTSTACQACRARCLKSYIISSIFSSYHILYGIGTYFSRLNSR